MAKRSSDTVVSLKHLKLACSNCNLHSICLPIGVNGQDLDALDDIIERRQPYKRGDYLFHQNDPFKAIYAVRSGSVKTYSLLDDGGEQITGFLLPGEIAGLDAINSSRHPCYAKALETTSVCEIPYERLEELIGALPSLRSQVLRLMSKEILEDEKLVTLLGKKTAEARLATLLISLSQRFKARGFSAHEFQLSMSRGDIGNFLGLAVETVSRLFTRYQEQGWITIEGKFVHLRQIDALHQLCGERNLCGEELPLARKTTPD